MFYTIFNLWRNNRNKKNMIENEVITKKPEVIKDSRERERERDGKREVIT